MATNPDIQALLNAVAAVQQEVIDLEGKVNSGTTLSSGDFQAIKDATNELNALAGGADPSPANSGGSVAPNATAGPDTTVSTSPEDNLVDGPGAPPQGSLTAEPGAGA